MPTNEDDIADIRSRRLRDDVGETYAEDTGILLDRIDELERAIGQSADGTVAAILVQQATIDAPGDFG